MCGICGVVAPQRTAQVITHQVQRMADSLTHRGPDDVGVRVFEPGVGLGHRRLSIFDLSAAGHQPMLQKDGPWAVVYNGEIYNFRELRSELAARSYVFESDGDTEVLLAALDVWGVEKTLAKLIGMFAFAAWNRTTNELILARDRLGQKPLYYGIVDGALVFGSELRVFRALGKPPSVDLDACAMMLRYNCIPAPHSALLGIKKLLPGSYLEYPAGEQNLGQPIKYWNSIEAQAVLSTSSEEGISNQLCAILEDAVRIRMASDVPLGAFLSGGIDSTLIVSLMQKNSSQRVRTFTIGYQDAAFNEASQAKAVAKHLGTDHTELYLTEADGLQLVPELGKIYDEPFGDSSQIPTLLLSQLTRQHVTVALSGDGGDEFFAGYNRHVWLPKIYRILRKVPLSLRAFVARTLRVEGLRSTLRHLSSQGYLKVRLVDDKLDKLSSMLDAKSFQAMYRQLLSDWKNPRSVIPRARHDAVDEFAGLAPEFTPLETICAADARMYLPDDIMVKVDRASMAHSLEARAPFLDHRLVEFSKTIPPNLKIDSNTGKSILRKLLLRHVPQSLFDRPKMGFAVPISDWLRGDLKDWAGDLLHTKWVRDEALMDAAPVHRAFQEHQSGQRERHHELWNVLMLISWLEANR